MAYLYRHIRLDKNEPFYIGIGSDKYFKRAKNSRQRNPVWKHIAAKTDYDVEILFDNIPLDEAKKKEVEFIALYGRINIGTGGLANITGGGDGMFDPPDSVRQHFSEIAKGEKNPFYGKKHSPETKLKMREASKTAIRPPAKEETKIKIGIANKGKAPFNKGRKDTKGALKRTGVNHCTYRGEVYCYDTCANLVKVYTCFKEAAVDLGTDDTNAIARVIRGERKHYKGFVFRLKGETPEKVKAIIRCPKRIQDTATGQIYATIKDAAEALSIPYKNLERYLNGTRENKSTARYLQQQ